MVTASKCTVALVFLSAGCDRPFGRRGDQSLPAGSTR